MMKMRNDPIQENSVKDLQNVFHPGISLEKLKEPVSTGGRSEISDLSLKKKKRRNEKKKKIAMKGIARGHFLPLGNSRNTKKRI